MIVNGIQHRLYIGWYAFVESNGNTGTAELISPWLTYNETYNCRLYGYYYMYGADVQNLSLTVERLRVTSYGYQVYGKQLLGIYTGNLGDNWYQVTATLRSVLGGQLYTPFRIRIGAGVNGKPYGDIAIDSISFGPCPGTGQAIPQICVFEVINFPLL